MYGGARFRQNRAPQNSTRARDRPLGPSQRRFQEFLTMQKVLILGAGKIGALVSGFLAECRDY